ncbi:MAG: AsmA family protein [Desulfobacterales bacterium]|nr:AsmA family protein [Desulfobacterales bacterium]
MRPPKLALIFFTVLLLCAAVAVGALLLVDPDVFHDQLEALASDAFGRDFRIGGAIGIKRSLRPQFILKEITIDNPDWAAGPHFARADHVAVRVALLPLLRGALRIRDVTFTGVEIHIEDGPGDANNYSFGEVADRHSLRQLPSIERMLVRDTVIHYRPPDGPGRRLEIATARLWNIPGEPERIAAEGMAQGLQYTLDFTSEPDAERSGPQHPWSVRLDMQGAGLALIIEGQMRPAFAWRQFDGRIAIRGEETDQLAILLGTKLPSAGPFDIAAAINSNQDTFKLTDLKARIAKIANRHDIRIADGDLSAGGSAPFRLNLRGTLDDNPLVLRLESEGSKAPDAPQPVTATLQIADTELGVRGKTSSADGQPGLTLEGRIQGRRLDTLTRLLDLDLPSAGPYQFSFQAGIGDRGYGLDRLAGEIKGIQPWDTIQFANGRAAVGPDGSIDAAIEARLNDVPLTVSFTGHPETSDEKDRRALRLQLDASLPGTGLTGKGAIVSLDDRFQLELTTHVQGDRLDILGSLIGVAMPPVGPYDVKADLLSADGAHSLQDIRIKLGADRMRGQLEWRDQAPRPMLTGRLRADRLAFKTLSLLEAPTTERIGSPIDLRWFNTFDARLGIAVAHLTGSPIPVRNIDMSATMAAGRLAVPFRAQIADAPFEGQLVLHQPADTPEIALHAEAGRIEADRAFEQIQLPGVVDGTIDAIRIEGRSSGRSWPSLLDRAVLKVGLPSADIHYAGQFIGRPIDLVVETAEFSTAAGQPLSSTFTGKIQDIPFDARANTSRLAELASTQTPLPIRLDLKTVNMEFKGRGTVARPIDKKVFDLEHEIAGDKIEGLDPLVDLAISLHGAFSARGTIAGRGDRVTYNEVLQVGKSHFEMTMNIDQAGPRPKISAQITSEDLYLEDVKLLPSGDEAEKGEYLIPDFSLPVDYLRASDLNMDIHAQHVHSDIGHLGALNYTVTIKDGHFEANSTISNPEGARLREFLDLNAAVNPPAYHYEVDGERVDYTVLRRLVPMAVIEEGALDFHLRLSGNGTTRRQFLSHADGLLTIIGGPGQLQERRIDLWAADLTTTLLSPKWQKQETTEVICMVARVSVVDGMATIDNMLLDTERVTIAGSGVINLKDETLDVYIAPRPKNPSLVSLANPVNITGTLSQPEITVAKLPGRKHRLARTGLLAGLINPLFLLTALTDTGTFGAESCTEAIEQTEAALEEMPP